MESRVTQEEAVIQRKSGMKRVCVREKGNGKESERSPHTVSRPGTSCHSSYFRRSKTVISKCGEVILSTAV